MRFLIADGHPLFRSGFMLLLSQMFPGTLFFPAGDADEAWEILHTEKTVDLLFLDLAMPGMNRACGIGRFVKRRPGVPVIILSAHAEAHEIAECMRLGARGYIPKHVSVDVLHKAIALMMDGEIFLPRDVINRFVFGNRDRHAAVDKLPKGNRLRALTPQQRATLAMVIEGRSNKEIARGLNLLETTVKAHVKVILNKLSARNRTEAVTIATELGWHELDHESVERAGADRATQPGLIGTAVAERQIG